MNDSNSQPPFRIAPLTADDVVLAQAHFARHRAESGRGDYHFMPFDPDDAQGPSGLKVSALSLPLTDCGWERWWVAWSGAEIVGHVDIKSGGLNTQLHRCELGIGIERDYRGQGLGRALMTTAIKFCQHAPSIDWLDLRVFAHNDNARHLYKSLGFEERGVMQDWIRIGPTRIDDVMMTLPVSSA